MKAILELRYNKSLNAYFKTITIKANGNITWASDLISKEEALELSKGFGVEIEETN